VGLASNTEIVAEKATELFGAESFRKAAILARHAKALKMPLSDLLSKKIAPMSGAWMEIKAKEGNKKVVVKDVGPILIVGPNANLMQDVSSRWNGFPFLSNVYEGNESGVAQWISVESWPPAAATFLIDAIAASVSKKIIKLSDCALQVQIVVTVLWQVLRRKSNYSSATSLRALKNLPFSRREDCRFIVRNL